MFNTYGMERDYIEALQEEFSAAKAAPRTSFPEGLYKVSVLESDVRVSKAGNTMWVLSYRMEEGVYKGHIYTEYIVFKSGANMERMKERTTCIMPEEEVTHIKQLLDPDFHVKFLDRLLTIKIENYTMRTGEIRQGVKIVSFDGVIEGEAYNDELPFDLN